MSISSRRGRLTVSRSEERRVGKECRATWAAYRADDGIACFYVDGVQKCALPIFLDRNLPVVPITDLTIKNGDLVVATQGRAFWILDDLTPLQLWKGNIESSDVYLFPPRPSHRIQIGRASCRERV